MERAPASKYLRDHNFKLIAIHLVENKVTYRSIFVSSPQSGGYHNWRSQISMALNDTEFITIIANPVLSTMYMHVPSKEARRSQSDSVGFAFKARIEIFLIVKC